MKKKNIVKKIEIKNANIINVDVNNKNLLLTKQLENFVKTIIIISSLIFFYRNYLILSSKTEIIIDNKLKIEKEDNINFFNYSTNIKAIAFYYPKIHLINEANKDKNRKKLIENKNVINNLKREIKLTKNHGIYGFGFFYFWSPDKKIFNEPLDIIITNPDFKIKFFLIWENNYFFGEQNSIDVTYNISDFYNDIKKYIIDERYIKINNKFVIGINRDDIDDNNINILRQKFMENNLGEIFILSGANDKNIKELINKNIYNGLYHSTSYDILEQTIFYFNKTYNYFYTHLLYENINFEYNYNYYKNNDISIFRTSFPVPKCPITGNKKNIKIYGDYTPDKFYFLNKIIIEWTKKYHDKENQYIFINGFNSFNNDNYLVSDDNMGFANINSFSKALYNLPLILYNSSQYNLTYLKKGVYVVVQAHVFYTDILPEVIIKTNNIEVPFDLYITTNLEEKKVFIEEYVKLNSKANKYEILVFPNKGRDTIPFLYQLKDVITKYKYVCHLHTKKHGYTKEEGENWRIYLYENLLGNKNITSKILSDFENNNKLGFFFPEHYHIQTKYVYNWNMANAKQVNHFFEILFPNKKIKVGETLDFPVGNMFWARTKAIYQLFNDKIIELCPKENGQIDGTVLHGIERTWLYLVKINGFFYKTNLFYLY